MSNNPSPQTIPALHPGEILHTLRDGFTRKVLVVRGRLHRATTAYRNGFYHSLRGEAGETLIALTPTALDTRLPRENGYLVTLRGYLDYTLSGSCIQPVLQVNEVLSCETAPAPDPHQQLLERIIRKQRRDVPTLLRRAILDGEKPRLLFLYPRESIVDHDVEKALGSYRSAFEIREDRVAFSPEVLSSSLLDADRQGYHAIAVIRGGGSGLDILNHSRLVETALSLKTPLIAALGHARDHTLLAGAADWRVETPSLLGTALRELLMEAGWPGNLPAGPAPRGISRELWLYRVLGLAVLGWLLWRWLT